MPKINHSILKALPIPVPSIPEQQEIVNRLLTLQGESMKTRETVESSRLRAKALKRGILKLAFEGRLVPHDLDDEPASILLERIQASREAEKSDTKRSRKLTSSQRN